MASVLGLLLSLMVFSIQSASGLGVNWGTIALNPLPPAYVAKMLQANGIKKVKFFDAAYDSVSSLAGTGIEVMVAAPNEMLASLANVPGTADAWVKQNVTGFTSTKGGVNITYTLTSCRESQPKTADRVVSMFATMNDRFHHVILVNIVLRRFA
jgi:hypothetical protein